MTQSKALGNVFKLRDTFNVKDPAYGAKGDGSTDDTAALAAVRTAAAAAAQPARIIFPPGIYKYSASPNWAIQDLQVDFEGEVRLRYTGTGIAVDLDGGAAGGGVYNTQFGVAGRVLIEAPTTATHAIRARALHHGKVRAKVLGAGSTSAGLKTNWCVCTEFDVIVSVNEEGAWYSVTKPAFGYDLDIRGASEFTSYCIFHNPIVEGPDIGVQLTGTLGNLFFGGTFEACSTYGAFASTGSNLDKFDGTDFESNTSQDVYNNGTGVEFNNCDTNGGVTFGTSCTKGKLVGGNHKTILLDATSSACTARDLVFNRANNGGTFSDNGNSNRVVNLTDGGKTYHDWDIDRYQTYEDDFLGDVLADQWNGRAGTDGACVAPIIGGSVLGGYVRLVGGAGAGADMATNGSQLDAGVLNWRTDNISFEMQFRIKLDTITSVAWFVGMTDQISALEMPFTLGPGDALTSNASDAVGVLFDTAADTDNWWLVGVANDVDATKQNSALAPTANVYETWRIQVTAAGVARFWRNKTLIGTSMTAAVRGTVLLTPVIAGFSRTAVVRRIDCDVIRMRSQRA